MLDIDDSSVRMYCYASNGYVSADSRGEPAGGPQGVAVDGPTARR